MNNTKDLDALCLLTSSEREIMTAILRTGQIARSSVTQKSQLSQQSVHRIIDSLEKRGYLRFGDAKIVGRGKPSVSVTIDPSNYASIGMSVSTENVRFCLLDLAGNPVIQETADVAPTDPFEVITALRDKTKEWSSSIALGKTLVGVGISMQGFRAGISDIFYPPEPLFAWHDVALEKVLVRELGLPSFAENNSTSSAVAEHYLGGGSGLECISYLSFNHGFGAGTFSDYKAFRGGHGNAGEISAIFSNDQITHRPALGELIKRLAAHNIDVTSVLDLTSNFDPDWPGVSQWLEEVKPQLQLALRALQATVDPNTIFFGGDAPDELRSLLIDIGSDAFPDKRHPRPNLVASKISGDPAHLGAALLPLHKLVF